MNIPDKLPYTKGEKIAEAVCGGICAAIVILELIMIIFGKTEGGTVIIIVSSFVVYGILSGCAVYPQHTNIFTKPENCSEKQFRTARKALIWSRLVLTAALFILTLLNGGNIN